MQKYEMGRQFNLSHKRLFTTGLGLGLTLLLGEACAPEIVPVVESPTPIVTSTSPVEPTLTNIPTPTPTDTLVPTPTIPREVLAGTPEALLQATAQWVLENGRKDSFVPEGEFTPELYEKVIAGTFEMLIEFETTASGCTSFAVAKEGNVIYFVTNKHAVLDEETGEPISRILIRSPLWRSGSVDYIELHDMKGIASGSRDLALMRGTVSEDIAALIQPLAYVDDYPIKDKDRMLVVGWPKEMRDVGVISANIMPADGDAINTSFSMIGLADHGSSGSPVIIADNGNPVVIGIAWSVKDKITYQNNKLTVTRSTLGYLLEIGRLMEDLRDDE